VAPVSLARDALLVLDPLNKPWVAQVNQAAADSGSGAWLYSTL
jgi:hypothetical protein